MWFVLHVKPHPKHKKGTVPTCAKFHSAYKLLIVQRKTWLKVQTEKFYIILCPLLAKGVLVPLDVAPRGAPRLLGNGLVAPGVVTHGPSAVLEAALGGPLVLMTTVKLTLTSHIAPWLATTSYT